MSWISVCEGGACVEVNMDEDPGFVAVRDGKEGDESQVLWFTREEWAQFVDATKEGRFDG